MLSPSSNCQPQATRTTISLARQPEPAQPAAGCTPTAAVNTTPEVLSQCTVIHTAINKQTASACSSSSSSSSSNDIAHVVTVIDTPVDSQHRHIEGPAHLSNNLSRTAVKLQNGDYTEPQPLQVSWQGVGCTYKTASGSKAVLQEVWGQAQAGEMQALLGPSGSGKSHLLDILAYRKTIGGISGDILVNGQKMSRNNYLRMVAYVPQDDNFIPALSATECLTFYAAMLLPNHQPTPAVDALLRCNTTAEEPQATIGSRKQHKRESQWASSAAVVEHVLGMVGLSKHASTMVGGRLPGGLLLRGLSSGERRRLSIAVGILAGPSLLFLDEPTSGLDSFAALSVMQHLQDVAHLSGKAVIAAIHQPRSAIWSLFDKVTLLASGLLLYHGPTAGLLPWLSGGLGYCYEPARHGLVSDWALDLVVVEFSKPQQATSGLSMTSVAELEAAAAAFKQQHFHRHQQAVQQQMDQQQGQAPVACVSAMTPAPAKQSVPSNRQSQVILHPAAGCHPSSNLPRGPFSRGGSPPSTIHVVLHSAADTRRFDDEERSSSSCNSKVSSAASDCDSSSSLGQQSTVQPRFSLQRGSSTSSMTPTTAAQVLQTMVATAGGVFHMSSLAAEATYAPVAVSCIRQTETEACAAALMSNAVHKPPHDMHGSAAVLQVMVTDTPTGKVPTASAPGSRDSGTGRTGQSCYPSSCWRQYQALVWRELLKVTRNPADVAGRTLTFTWVALLVGLIYYDMPLDASSIRQRLNLLFATLCFFLLMPFISMSMYTDDKSVYLADRAARLYRPVAYYLAKSTVVLPFNIISSLCYTLIQYGMTGMRPGPSSVLQHSTIGMLTSLIAVQVLHLAATVTPNQDGAFMMGIGWTCTNLVMSGFFIPYQEIRFSALSNLRYLSALHYAFEGLLGVEFGGRTFPCPTVGIDAVSADFFTQLLPGAVSLVTPGMLQRLTNGTEAATGGCVVNSAAVAQYFGFGRSFGVTIGVLVAYLGVLHALTFSAMLLVTRKEGR